VYREHTFHSELQDFQAGILNNGPLFFAAALQDCQAGSGV